MAINFYVCSGITPILFAIISYCQFTFFYRYSCAVALSLPCVHVCVCEINRERNEFFCSKYFIFLQFTHCSPCGGRALRIKECECATPMSSMKHSMNKSFIISYYMRYIHFCRVERTRVLFIFRFFPYILCMFICRWQNDYYRVWWFIGFGSWRFGLGHPNQNPEGRVLLVFWLHEQILSLKNLKNE